MAMVANDPAAAKRLGIPQSVGKDFVKADVGRTFKEGGDMKKMNTGGSTGSGGRGVTTVPGDKKLGSQPRYVTKILPSGSKPLTAQRPEKEGSGFKRGGMAKTDMMQDKGMMQKAVNKHEGRLHKGAAMTKLAKGGATKTMQRGGKC
jgi:hypothetical protein